MKVPVDTFNTWTKSILKSHLNFYNHDIFFKVKIKTQGRISETLIFFLKKVFLMNELMQPKNN